MFNLERRGLESLSFITKTVAPEERQRSMVIAAHLVADLQVQSPVRADQRLRCCLLYQGSHLSREFAWITGKGIRETRRARGAGRTKKRRAAHCAGHEWYTPHRCQDRRLRFWEKGVPTTNNFVGRARKRRVLTPKCTLLIQGCPL